MGGKGSGDDGVVVTRVFNRPEWKSIAKVIGVGSV